MANGKQAEAIFDTSGLQELVFMSIRDASVDSIGLLHFTLYTLRRLPGFKEPVWVPVQPLVTPVNCLASMRDQIDAVIGKNRISQPNAGVAPKINSLVH